jgi:MFS family permease
MCLVTPRWSDLRGRRKVIIANMIVYVLSSVMVLASRSLSMTYVAVFLAGGTVISTTGVNFVYLLEFLSEKWRPSVATLFQLCIVSVLALQSLYFQYVSTDYRGIIYISIVTSIIVIVFLLYWDESPEYLLKAGLKTEAINVIQRIHKVNKCNTRNTSADLSWTCEQG